MLWPDGGIMFDPVTLATTTVAVLSPYFAAAAKKAAEKLGEDTYAGARKVVAWLRSNLSSDKDGELKKALDRVESDPANVDKTAALRVALAEFLTAHPGLSHQLNESLPVQNRISTTMSATTQGNDNSTIQAAGQNIHIESNRR